MVTVPKQYSSNIVSRQMSCDRGQDKTRVATFQDKYCHVTVPKQEPYCFRTNVILWQCQNETWAALFQVICHVTVPRQCSSRIVSRQTLSCDSVKTRPWVALFQDCFVSFYSLGPENRKPAIVMLPGGYQSNCHKCLCYFKTTAF